MLKEISIICATAIVACCEEVIWEIPLGTLKGLKLATAYQNKTFYSFRSIPYVKPVTGINKFEPTQPIERWQGVLDATKPTIECVYFCPARKIYIGDEDCLQMNIYTPLLDTNAEKAVLLWIHAGGFNYLSGDDGVLGPDFLIEKDIILVSFNYRLGPMGFLNTGDVNAPGNMGLKDQVMALKWVRQYIKYFGGDPEKITLGGMNSGAASVQLHMMSPMSRGMFRGGLEQSGTSLNPWVIQYKPREVAFQLGEVLGVKPADSKELVDKLKTFSAKELMVAAEEVSKSLSFMSGSVHAFLPSVEIDVGQEIFLPADPWTLIKEGKIADVPLIAGMNLDEEATMAARHIKDADMMNNHFEYFIPVDLNVTDAERKQYSEMIRNFYFDGQALTTESLEEFTKLLTDITFTYGVHYSTKLISQVNSSPVYKYLLTHYSPVGPLKNMYSSETGVAHGDEIKYVFYSQMFNNLPPADSAQEKIMHMFTTMWTNFAKTGNPTTYKDEYVTIDWLPIGTEDNYIEIDEELKIKSGFYQERMHLWAKICTKVLGRFTDVF
ncbi:venom carboxylesterase-6 [Nasonia vitripennis]|uniref:Carboxylesterase type B domain-containing protein n=1 Tax=Nasonia vitripennis TaxID=7425 RepID=A0A7M7Q6D8_NASVI|nr:venom carboxylesterase-6 [Nasonia vitripennis]